MSLKSFKKIIAISSLLWLFSPILAMASLEVPSPAKMPQAQTVAVDQQKTAGGVQMAPESAPQSVIPVGSGGSCQTSVSSAQNLVQGIASINLNQSAACFSLNLGILKTQEHISVRPLNANNNNNIEIKVVRNFQFSSPNLSPFAPFVQIPSAVPAVFSLSLIFALAVFAAKGAFRRGKRNFSYNYLGIHYIGIMRC